MDSGASASRVTSIRRVVPDAKVVGVTTQRKRVPYLNFLPDAVRNHFIAMCGEFAGTFLFLFFAFSGTQVANSETQGSATTIAQGSNPAQLLYISLCFGFSLAVTAWVFFRISGGLFNPAVTLGMVVTGSMPPTRGGLIFISQILGAVTSAGIVSALFPGPLSVRTSLGAGTSIAQGLFIEMFLTAQLVFTIFMLAAEKHKATFIAPIGIGLSLFIAELSGVYYTGGSLNPARSFAPDVVNRSFFSYHWIYWVGPILGSLLASGFYKFMQAIEYETANPGQDFDENETQLFDPEKDVNRPIVNVAAGGALTDPAEGTSRPISGDTMTNYLGQEPHRPAEPSTSSFHGRPVSASAVNGERGGSNVLRENEITNNVNGETSTMYRDAPDVESGRHYTIGDPVLSHQDGLGAGPSTRL